MRVRLASFVFVISHLFFFASASELNEKMGESLVDERLRRSYLYGDNPLVRSVLEDHVRLFPGSFDHDWINFFIDPAMVVNVSTRLQEKLESIETYWEDMKSRGPLLNISIINQEDQIVESREWKNLSRAGMELWEKVGEIKDDGDTRLLLIEEAIGTNWKEIASSGDRLDAELSDLLSAYVLISTLGRRVTFLSEGMLDYLSEEEFSRPLLRELSKKIGIKESHERELFVEVSLVELSKKKAQLERDFSVLVRQGIKKGETIFLEEVPPALADFRGFVGNDCSTSFSTGYPRIPQERVYYIRNARGKYLGYVSGTMVSIGDRPAMFFHTIAGPEVGYMMSHLIMKGIYAAREQIGMELVALPDDQRIFENINWLEISDAMREMAGDLPHEDVRFVDTRYRDVVYNYVKTDLYDNAFRNRFGRVIQPDVSSISVKVEESSLSLFGPWKSRCETALEPAPHA